MNDNIIARREVRVCIIASLYWMLAHYSSVLKGDEFRTF
jgi:hypothetical protein